VQHHRVSNGLGQPRIDNETVAVLCHQMPHVTELGLFAGTFAEQPGIGVGGRGVRVIPAFFAMKIALGVASTIGIRSFARRRIANVGRRRSRSSDGRSMVGSHYLRGRNGQILAGLNKVRILSDQTPVRVIDQPPERLPTGAVEARRDPRQRVARHDDIGRRERLTDEGSHRDVRPTQTIEVQEDTLGILELIELTAVSIFHLLDPEGG